MTREEAIKRLEKVEIQDGWSDEDKEYYSLIIEALYQPKIIYCRDCKYSSDESVCPLYYSGKPYEEDFYCSFAERKDD